MPVKKLNTLIGKNIFKGEYKVPILNSIKTKRAPSRSKLIWLLPTRLSVSIGTYPTE